MHRKQSIPGNVKNMIKCIYLNAWNIINRIQYKNNSAYNEMHRISSIGYNAKSIYGSYIAIFQLKKKLPEEGMERIPLSHSTWFLKIYFP